MNFLNIKSVLKHGFSPPTLAPGQFLNLSSFARKLQSSSDATSEYLYEHLSAATQNALADFTQCPDGESVELGQLLAEDLTRLIRGPCIYEPSRFARVQFRSETQVLLTAEPAGSSTPRLNRLLLEDAYPGELSKEVRLSRMRKVYKWMTQQQPVSWLTGRKYARSREAIEIDVTYACNLKCFNCNRSCTQAPARDAIAPEQIIKFLSESVEAKVTWRKIHVMGGEPTLHPQLEQILELLVWYKQHHNPKVELKLVSNGFGPHVENSLGRVPAEVAIVNTSKKSPVQEFDAFNMAPKDRPLNWLSDFRRGCVITNHCGMGLTPWGYYCCAIAGAIDRIFGFDLGRKQLPAKDDSMQDQMRLFCRLCGHFNREWQASTATPRLSRTWRKAYAAYRVLPPQLTRY